MGGTKPWPQVPVGNKDHTSAAVVIIGAGISGMCMAMDLVRRNNCRNFILLEKSSGVGGTWHDNKYPGCCCDVWSLLYSYSFEQNPDWTREYPGQEEILSYLTTTASKHNLYQHIRFNTEATSAHWDPTTLKWKVSVNVAPGSKDGEFQRSYTITTDFLVSAVGQLSRPRWPTIPGMQDFKGKMMHTARWDWSYELAGKRIGIVGNGATAVQIIPEVLKVAKSITVYQRTPNWVIPRLDSAVPAWKQVLYRYLPPIRWRARAQMMDYRESFYDAVTDKTSAFAQGLSTASLEMMKRDLPDRPDLWEKLTPTYSPGCKRVLITDDYYKALANPNCRLETREIKRITETGIEVGEEEEEFDLIVCATGFRTTEFLHPIEIVGSNGRRLADVWKEGGGPCAYNGVVVQDLPNFGLFYGPNTNLGHNSIILMIEAQSRYINALFSAVLDAKRKNRSLALKPRAEVVERYNDKVQDILNQTSFAESACASWYKTAEGRITNNWSGTVIEYQELLSRVDWSDYVAEGDGANLVWNRAKTELGRVREETVVSDGALAMGVGVAAIAALVGGLAATGRLKIPVLS